MTNDTESKEIPHSSVSHAPTLRLYDGLNGSRDLDPELARAFAGYQERLYHHIHSILGNRADSEEVLSHTLVRAVRGYANFRGDSKIETWLHRIGVNLAKNKLSYFVRRGRNRSASLNADEYYEGAFGLCSMERPAQALMEEEELKALINRGYKQLIPMHQDIWHLRVNLDKSYTEIAQLLDINLGTVKSRLARARGCMKDFLKAAVKEEEPIDSDPIESMSWQIPTVSESQNVTFRRT